MKLLLQRLNIELLSDRKTRSKLRQQRSHVSLERAAGEKLDQLLLAA
jgi:hypothetical protein